MEREKTNVRLYIPADKTHKDSFRIATKALITEQE